ncbi:hypothetical protein [Streptomyces sp. DHE17-7]|uniref:hypothetical protein n=1 Tax=Streptomyces sp. DHE17-7 TaxID=2759949 RepID=UPI0022EA5427|nr:hypothetical protein [Streptomyces sp. DHE17-7]MBJ6623449.1 hypothetical protein [Streptomyces sp. DHE17-7]
MSARARRQTLPPTGMVTETPPFADCGLPALASLVFGGHDTATTPLPKRAEELAAQGVLPPWLPTAVQGELAAADEHIRPGGPVPGDRRATEELIADFATDLRTFARTTGVARTVVVNVASTEPNPAHGAWPASSLYAAAALRAGCPYVNQSREPPEPPHWRRGPATRPAYRAATAKTGADLCSVLGRCPPQRATAGRPGPATNRCAAADGERPQSPTARRNAAAKNAGKERVLTDTLGTRVEGEVHIDDVPALGDWKTAWDHVAPTRPSETPHGFAQTYLAGLRLPPRERSPEPGPPPRTVHERAAARWRTRLLLQGPRRRRLRPGRAVHPTAHPRRPALRRTKSSAHARPRPGTARSTYPR